MTDSDTTAAAILKSDTRGRVRSTAAQRQRVLEEFERSGLSGPQFARVAGVAYQTFATWRQKHRKAATLAARPGHTVPADAAGTVRLVEAVVAASARRPGPAPAAGAMLKIDLPGGASVTLADSMQAVLAAHLLKALAASSSC